MHTLAEWGSVSDIVSASCAVLALLGGGWAWFQAKKSESSADMTNALRKELADELAKLRKLEEARTEERVEIQSVGFKPIPIAGLVGQRLTLTVVNYSHIAVTLASVELNGDGEVKCINSEYERTFLCNAFPLTIGPRQRASFEIDVLDQFKLGTIISVVVRTATGESCSFFPLTFDDH